MWSNISAANNVSAGTWLSTRPGPKTWRRQGSEAVDSFLGAVKVSIEIWNVSSNAQFYAPVNLLVSPEHIPCPAYKNCHSLVSCVHWCTKIWYDLIQRYMELINRWIDICISTICHIATRFILQEHYLVFTDILPKDFMAQFYLPSDRLQKIWLWRW